MQKKATNIEEPTRIKQEKGLCTVCFLNIEVEEKEAPKVVPTQDTKEKKEEERKETQIDTSKCWNCKRKVGLLGFRCRCE
jgi:hypothetical protein